MILIHKIATFEIVMEKKKWSYEQIVLQPILKHKNQIYKIT